jgi:hypothetical protein
MLSTPEPGLDNAGLRRGYPTNGVRRGYGATTGSSLFQVSGSSLTPR